jgi:hypothetical protein
MLKERTALSGVLGFRPELSQVGAVIGLWCIRCHGPQPWFELTILTGDIAMIINPNDDTNIPVETEDRYETLARQEEIYLEETEEEVHAILTSDDQSPAQTRAKYWRSKIEELELDWEIEIL